jgi:hypothetical protein
MQNLGREGLQVRSGCLDFYASKLGRESLIGLNSVILERQ